MTGFASLAELSDACLHLPQAHPGAAERVASREATLTKPPGSLGGSRSWSAGSRSGRAAIRRAWSGSISWCLPAITG